MCLILTYLVILGADPSCSTVNLSCTRKRSVSRQSMTPVANNGNTIRLLTGIMWIYEFIHVYVDSATQRCNIFLFFYFLIEDFWICHRCQRHQWCTLSCDYLREFSKNFETVLTGYSGAGGNWFKNLKSKISWHCPLKTLTFEIQSAEYKKKFMHLEKIITEPHTG